MPLTVDEVSAAPGPASAAPGLQPPAPGGRVPCGRRLYYWRQGNLVERYLPNQKAGGEGGRGIAVSTCHPAEGGGAGWGGGLQVGLFRGTQIHITGDQNAPKRVGVPPFFI